LNKKIVKKMVGEVETEGKSKQVFGMVREGSAGGRRCIVHVREATLNQE
jgi:hypothetical protein